MRAFLPFHPLPTRRTYHGEHFEAGPRGEEGVGELEHHRPRRDTQPPVYPPQQPRCVDRRLPAENVVTTVFVTIFVTIVATVAAGATVVLATGNVIVNARNTRRAIIDAAAWRRLRDDLRRRSGGRRGSGKISTAETTASCAR